MCLKPLAISCLSGHLSACIPPVTRSLLPTKFPPPHSLFGILLRLSCYLTPWAFHWACRALWVISQPTKSSSVIGIPRSAPARRHLALLAVSTAQNAQRAHSFPFSGSLCTGHLFFLFFFFRSSFQGGQSLTTIFKVAPLPDCTLTRLFLLHFLRNTLYNFTY